MALTFNDINSFIQVRKKSYICTLLVKMHSVNFLNDLQKNKMIKKPNNLGTSLEIRKQEPGAICLPKLRPVHGDLAWSGRNSTWAGRNFLNTIKQLPILICLHLMITKLLLKLNRTRIVGPGYMGNWVYLNNMRNLTQRIHTQIHSDHLVKYPFF